MGIAFGRNRNYPEQRQFSALQFATQKESSHAGFAANTIRTSKYTPLTFIFLNLWEQFQRLANVYFLLISILQFIPQLSSMSPTSWIPLVIVLFINMIKEGVEDYRRSQMDKEINSKPVRMLTSEGIAKRQWKDILVGAVVLLEHNDPVPADVIVLATSDADSGLVYIETSNLDGETNLKNRESIEEVHKEFLEWGCDAKNVAPNLAAALSEVTVECENPNADLHTFTGTIACPRWAGKSAVTGKQVVFRGCTVKNTKWMYGLVVFAGMETKLMMNATEKRLKRTSLDTLTNTYLVGVFIFLFLICVLGGVFCGIWSGSQDVVPFYLIKQLDNVIGNAFLTMITFLILLSALIPISLTVTMEMVKVFHAYFLNVDVTMCYEDPLTNAVTPARARTSNLTEELGRIQYVFSDKTGTLTQNVMEFMKCSIAGSVFGSGITEIARSNAALEGRRIEEVPRPPGLQFERGNNFYDPQITMGAWRNLPIASQVADFFTALAVCHTVIPSLKSGAEDDDSSWRKDNVAYQASSPDEEALVVGAKGAGFWFKRRNYKDVIVEIDGTGSRVFQVLNVNEFNSTRKRMSAVILDPTTGRTTLIVKGADNVMYERLKPTAQFRDETKDHLRTFANEGLRTLVLAKRDIDQDEYAQWNARYSEAFTSTSNREDRLADVAEDIEKDLTLIGATAIEDKLQEGVPVCIRNLKLANVQIWVLTGDKVETAINITHACNLLDNNMSIHKVTLPDPPYFSPEDPQYRAKVERARQERYDSVIEQFQHAQRKLSALRTALVIDGYSLEFALLEEAQASPKELGTFLAFATRCQAVVCCRVSPKQKADVVEAVRSKVRVPTLAIGDGANDVGMILKAHVGVGISGREGVQAVMASDYAVAQFRYLQQLLLVHGRWDFQRVSVVILYFFYKNIAFAVPAFWYGIFTGYSGPIWWDDYYQSVWNVVFTSLPIFAVAAFDKDLRYQATLNQFPHLFESVQRGDAFTKMKFLAWCLEGIWTSVVVFFVPSIVFAEAQCRSNGLDDGKWLVSFTVFCCCSLSCNLRLAVEVKTWTVPTTLLMILSILSYFIFSVLYCNLPISWSREMYRMFTVAVQEPAFWLCVGLCVVLSLMPALVLRGIVATGRNEDIVPLRQREQALAATILTQRKSAPDTRPQQGAVSVPPHKGEGALKSPATDARKKSFVTEDEMATAWTATCAGKPTVQLDNFVGPKGVSLRLSDDRNNATQEYLGYSFSAEGGMSPQVQLAADHPVLARRASARQHGQHSPAAVPQHRRFLFGTAPLVLG